MTTGRNFQMRYATRTSRLPIGWMHERFKAGDLDLKYEVSARMAADIYNKAFSDADKWQSACWLINIVDPQVIQSAIKYVTYDEPDLGSVKPEDFPDEDWAMAVSNPSSSNPRLEASRIFVVSILTHLDPLLEVPVVKDQKKLCLREKVF